MPSSNALYNLSKPLFLHLKKKKNQQRERIPSMMVQGPSAAYSKPDPWLVFLKYSLLKKQSNDNSVFQVVQVPGT